MNEMWIELECGAYPDGYPKSIYRHKSCSEVNESVSKAYPYCPYCGKKITHIKLINKDMNWFFECKGFICE